MGVLVTQSVTHPRTNPYKITQAIDFIVYFYNGAGSGNRTRTLSLEGSYDTISPYPPLCSSEGFQYFMLKTNSNVHRCIPNRSLYQSRGINTLSTDLQAGFEGFFTLIK